MGEGVHDVSVKHEIILKMNFFFIFDEHLRMVHHEIFRNYYYLTF